MQTFLGQEQLQSHSRILVRSVRIECFFKAISFLVLLLRLVILTTACDEFGEKSLATLDVALVSLSCSLWLTVLFLICGLDLQQASKTWLLRVSDRFNIHVLFFVLPSVWSLPFRVGGFRFCFWHDKTEG